MNEKIRELSEIIKESNRIVFFGGAGVSTSSNIPDFRSSNGLYSKKLNCNFTPEQALSRSFFNQYPDLFFDFYKTNMVYPHAKPNECHITLVKLEEMGKLRGIVTQNIDGLHQAAGSKIVYELHGSVLRNYCLSCHRCYDTQYILRAKGIPRCEHCNGIVKPDVVLYEEELDQNIINSAIRVIKEADTLIIGGTSLAVYPAAGLIHYFKGRNLILINKSETSADSYADIVVNEDIAVVLKQALELISKP